MMPTSTAVPTRPGTGGCGCGGGCRSGGSCGCGSGGTCGCGGAPAQPGAFTRPRFFAGQLLTEDDLELLTAYVTGKGRLRNRMLSGPGVVCGLEVVCDPCGGDTVVVRPGYALDCCGNDIVVSCAEPLSVAALVHELRVRALGVDCGDPCGNGPDGSGTRQYGLYVRYVEEDSEPVAPFVTGEPCPPTGCEPSRVREGFRFLLRCPPDGPDHRYDPAERLAHLLGGQAGFVPVWSRGRRLDQYRERLRAAALAAGKVIVFERADGERFSANLDRLRDLLTGIGERERSADTDRELTELVRGLASAVARYDLYGPYDKSRQETLRKLYPDLARLDEARETLNLACGVLRPTVEDTPAAGTAAGGAEPGRARLSLPELTWPDPVRRGIARAVVNQTVSQVVDLGASDPASMERRLVALGAPLDFALRAELRADLARLREWLLVRLETSASGTSCALRGTVAAIAVPPPLPPPADGEGDPVSPAELLELARVADAVYGALYEFVSDQACASLLPPCSDCADPDVLLATLEVRDCTVLRICAGDREQVLPGGSAYSRWLPTLHRLRQLASAVCCRPGPRDSAVVGEDGVTLRYGPGWLSFRPDPSKLGRLLSGIGLVDPTVPAPRPLRPAAEPPAVAVGAPESAAVRVTEQGLADLRGEVAGLTAQLAELRAEVQAETDRLSRLHERVRADLPDRLGERLTELERRPRQPRQSARPAGGGAAAGSGPTRSRSGRAAGGGSPAGGGAPPAGGSGGAPAVTGPAAEEPPAGGSPAGGSPVAGSAEGGSPAAGSAVVGPVAAESPVAGSAAAGPAAGEGATAAPAKAVPAKKATAPGRPPAGRGRSGDQGG